MSRVGIFFASILLGASLFAQTSPNIFIGEAEASNPNAFRLAIEHVFEQALLANEIILISRTEADGQTIVQSELSTYSHGYVDSYNVISTTVTNNRLRVEAEVTVQKIGDDVLGFFKSAEFARKFGRPQVFLQTKVSVDGAGQGADDQKNWFENYVAERLSVYPLDLRTEGGDDGIRIECSLGGGRGDPLGGLIDATKSRSYDLQVTLKALASESSRQLGIATRDLSRIEVDPHTDRAALGSAIKTLIESGDSKEEDLIDILMGQITLQYILDRNMGSPLLIRIRGGSFKDAVRAKDILNQRLSGIRGIHLSCTTGECSLNLLCDPGLSERIAGILSAEGGKIEKVSDHEIDIQMAQNEAASSSISDGLYMEESSGYDRDTLLKTAQSIPIIGILLFLCSRLFSRKNGRLTSWFKSIMFVTIVTFIVGFWTQYRHLAEGVPIGEEPPLVSLPEVTVPDVSSDPIAAKRTTPIEHTLIFSNGVPKSNIADSFPKRSQNSPAPFVFEPVLSNDVELECNEHVPGDICRKLRESLFGEINGSYSGSGTHSVTASKAKYKLRVLVSLNDYAENTRSISTGTKFKIYSGHLSVVFNVWERTIGDEGVQVSNLVWTASVEEDLKSERSNQTLFKTKNASALLEEASQIFSEFLSPPILDPSLVIGNIYRPHSETRRVSNTWEILLPPAGSQPPWTGLKIGKLAWSSIDGGYRVTVKPGHQIRGRLSIIPLTN